MKTKYIKNLINYISIFLIKMEHLRMNNLHIKWLFSSPELQINE